MKWPRGKYNGKKIAGFRVSVRVHVFWWNWKPKKTALMQYYHWLCFTLFIETEYND